MVAPNHVNYSFRAMAQDQVEVMAALGHDRFFLAGHDRGARTAHRLALDHPDRVRKVALLDIVPTRYVWDTHLARVGAGLLALVVHGAAGRTVRAHDRCDSGA